MTYRLERRTLIAAPLDDVFEFFSHPENLERLTPAWLHFRITSTTDERVREGTRIRYRLRLFGIPFNWESRITEFEKGVLFADEQISGPYALWYHRHRFRQHEKGVEMIDEVDYRLPLGPLGRVAHWFIVRHQLRAIFNYRERAITAVFPTVR